MSKGPDNVKVYLSNSENDHELAQTLNQKSNILSPSETGDS